MDPNSEDELMKEWAAMTDQEIDPPCDTNAAQEWEDMLSKSDATADQSLTSRVLNQDEIDSLLGFDGGNDSEWSRKLRRREMLDEMDEMAEDYPALKHALEKAINLYKLRKAE